MRWKVYLGRAGQYVAIINTCMIGVLFLSNFGIDLDLRFWGIPLIMTLASLLVFLGYIEVRFGFMKSENHEMNLNNPQIIEILEIMRRLEQRK